jgi:type I pantothenate kinase
MAADDAYGALAERIAAGAAAVHERPYVVAVTGSVSVGKTTVAAALRATLSASPYDVRVAVVSTDGFLLTNATLVERGLLADKGFPTSFDLEQLNRFLRELRAGAPRVAAPVYSHERYDVLPDESIWVEGVDVVIVEGLHLLHDGVGPFDLTVYLDADEPDVVAWFLARFEGLRQAATHDPGSFYRRFSALTPEGASEVAREVWEGVNGPNLRHHIAPTRERADIVLEKGADHGVRIVRPGADRADR